MISINIFQMIIINIYYYQRVSKTNQSESSDWGGSIFITISERCLKQVKDLLESYWNLVIHSHLTYFQIFTIDTAGKLSSH